MHGSIQNLIICDRNCILYLPEKYESLDIRYPVVYINGEDEICEIMKCVEPHFDVDCEKFILLSIQSDNWGSDYTPWPAPPFKKGDEAFQGNASKYLDLLINKIKPYMDNNYKTKSDSFSTAIVGYSLGGLTSLFALYKARAFGKIGSLSGSLWYDGWIEFMEANIPINKNSKVYISLGKKEGFTKNQRMKTVGDCTRKAYDILSEHLNNKENVTIEWNNGGHFTEIPERFVKALLRLYMI